MDDEGLLEDLDEREIWGIVLNVKALIRLLGVRGAEKFHQLFAARLEESKAGSGTTAQKARGRK